MTLFQLAFKNVIRDKHTYISYFISCTVTILIFYLFMASSLHPDLSVIQQGATLSLALTAGNIVIYCFAFLFIGYSSYSFLSSRGKQLGIYTILGMSPKQMKKMIYFENMLIGICSLLTGVISGIVFSGLFFKLIKNLFLSVSFEMYFPILPMSITIVLFLVLFFIIGILIPKYVSRKNVIEFLKSDKAYAQKLNVSKLSIVCTFICLGFIVILLSSQFDDIIGDLWTPLIFICILAFIFFFTPQLGAIMAMIERKSAKHFKGIRLFADTEMSITLHENRHIVSLITILLTMSFLAICALGSMQSNVLNETEKVSPFAYLYIERPNNTRAENDIAYLDNELLNNEEISKIRYEVLRKQYTVGFLKASDLNKILISKEKETVQLKNKEVALLPGNSDTKIENLELSEETKEILKNNQISFSSIKKIPQLVGITGAFSQICVVDDSTWDLIKTKEHDLYIENYTAYEDKNWNQNLEQSKKMESHFLQSADSYDNTYSYTSLGSHYTSELLVKKLATFVGVSISILFLIASISIIYFRLYTTLEREKKKYISMYKLGFSKEEMYKTIRKKITPLLWIPFSIAVVLMWGGMFYLEMNADISVLPMLLKYSLIFIGIYLIFYELVLRIYREKFLLKKSLQ